MADLQPVRPPRSPFSGHGALIGSIVVIGVLLAAVKPWGGTGGPPAATLFPSAAVAPSIEAPDGSDAAVATPSEFDLRYRPDLFGPEPPPRWGLWPAGYITTMGFVLPVPPEASPGVRPSARPSAPATASAPGSATASPPGSATTRPSSPSSSGAPDWPARIDITEGNHLLVLGISTPVGYQVPEIGLFRSETDGTSSQVETEILPTPWPDHFTVIGIRGSAPDGSLRVWPDGDYRLDWRTEPGGIRQSIEIKIRSGPLESPAP